MEAEAKGRSLRDTSDHSRAKMIVSNSSSNNSNNNNRGLKPAFKKVQVVYYLSRNGQLEHPHYMEVSHLAHQHLRLKDVMDRVTVLRGKGMPSLYSWSCKRSYKNGYVWNDLSENDVISPSEGAEYVLKGSELIEGCNEKFQQQLQITNGSQGLVPDPAFHSKRRTTQTERHPQPESDNNKNIIPYVYENDEEQNLYHEDIYRRTSYTSSVTPQHLRCSKGVSTDELTLEEPARKSHKMTVLTLDNNCSPPSTTSSTASDKAANDGNNNTSKRFELDGRDQSPVSRNSVLLKLISCGSTSFRAKAVPVIKEQSYPGIAPRKSGVSDLLKTATYKAAIETKTGSEEEQIMIKCMSENPRFGNLQAEEKEYFSGSIVEEAIAEERASAGLIRSSSYNEERNKKAALCAADADHRQDLPKKEKVVAKGKCIPRMMYYYSSSKQSKK